MKVTWIAGNHCGPANSISHLLGITVQDEYILYSGQKKILVIHGDQFDDFINKHPIITSIADSIYYALQSFTTHSMASYIKRASKTFLRCTKKVKKRSVEYAKKKYCDAICVAHTHFSESDIESCPQYFNSGSWTEIPSTYLMIINGNIELKNIFPNTYEKEKIN
jgi:UDP-2,3-diacylglucosamine pyrophosphatase LpxH